MKEEQERPRIKLKIRKIEEPRSTNLTGQNNDDDTQENTQSLETPQNEEPTKKIVIRHKLDEPEEIENEGKTAKKRSFFQIFAIILTSLLVVAIVVEIAVMVWLKTSTDSLKDKNGKLPVEQTTISAPLSTPLINNELNIYD